MPTAPTASGGTPARRAEQAGTEHDQACGQPVAILVAGEETGGRFALVRVTARRGWEPPRHLHRREDETLCVLAGDLTCYVGGEPRPVPVGTCVYLPRGLEHGFVVESDEATILHVFTPAGYEGAIRELAMAAPSSTAPPPAAGLPDVERLVTVAARYGCEITGPPLAPGLFGEFADNPGTAVDKSEVFP